MTRHIRDEKIIRKIYLKIVKLSTLSGIFSRSAFVCKYYTNQIPRKSIFNIFKIFKNSQSKI